MHRCLFSWLSVCLLSSVAVVQYGSTTQSSVSLGGRSFSDGYAAQRVLLSNFCRLDFEGARLQPGAGSASGRIHPCAPNPNLHAC